MPQTPRNLMVLLIILILVLFQEEPFVEKVNESVRLPKGDIVPKTLLQGFCIDLIEELSKLAKFEYDIYLDKNYDGLVEELTQQVVYVSR